MADPAPSPKRALIADDDEFFRLAASAILSRRLGMDEVIEAADFDQALAVMSRDGGAGLVIALVDLRMPGMAGGGSLSALRQAAPRTRIAMCSASRAREDVLAALHAGAHGYIWKATGAADLERAISAILAGELVVPAFLADIETSRRAHGDAGPTAAPVLTARQKDVLRQLVEGRSNKEIARSLSLGEGTVKVHVAALLRALGVSNRAAAAAIGARFMDEK